MRHETAKPRKQRTAIRQEAIVKTLRERIIAGAYTPGSKFPSRLVLQEEFQASSITVQRALDSLIADGFLYTRGHVGTYMAYTPPHQHTNGVFFDDQLLAKPNDGTFWSQLAYHCLALQQSGQAQLNLYFNITGHTDDPDYQRALTDLANQRLAGLIFAATFNPLQHTPLVTTPGLPRVALFGWDDVGVPYIEPPMTLFFEKALSYLAGRGRRRVALIAVSRQAVSDYLDPILAQSPLTSHRLWQIPVHTRQTPDTLEYVRITTTLLMDYGDIQPDAFIIFDDILVDYVTAGLIDAGVQIGENVDVVAHCNYPLIKPDQWPIQRLGYDTATIFTQAVELLHRQQQGEMPALRNVIAPYFPNELAPCRQPNLLFA